MKKVLTIVPYQYLPFFSGGQKFIAQFTEYLGEQCELYVAGTSDNDTTAANNYSFQPLLKKSRFRYADLGSFFRIKSLILAKGIDTVIIEHPYLGWLGWLLKKACGIKLIVHTHNIEHERFRTLGKTWWPLLQWYETWVLRKADQVYCITEEDRAYMIQHMRIPAANCILVPYGITIDAMPTDHVAAKEAVCQKHGFKPNHALLFFNGLLDYKPNYDALEVILNELLPRLEKQGLQYQILITGKRLPSAMNELKAWNQRNVFYAGFVDDIALYFKAADLFLNPVQSGGGVKTKMIEAIACGTTVVSTKTGATGMEAIVCDGKLLIVADHDWDAFTATISNHSQTSIATPSLYYDFYYWRNIIGKLIGSLA